MGLFFEGKGMSRILQHLDERNGGIITAFRPEEALIKGESNVRRNKKLAGYIKASHFGYVRVVGAWFAGKGSNVGDALRNSPDIDDGKEESFFVIGAGKPNAANFKAFLGDLCAEFDQEAVFMSTIEETGRLTAYYDDLGNIKRRFGNKAKLKDPKQCVEDYFKYLLKLKAESYIPPSGYSIYKRFTFVFDEVLEERDLGEKEPGGLGIKSRAFLALSAYNKRGNSRFSSGRPIFWG